MSQTRERGDKVVGETRQAEREERKICREES
jgi:hypothetical protein